MGSCYAVVYVLCRRGHPWAPPWPIHFFSRKTSTPPTPHCVPVEVYTVSIHSVLTDMIHERNVPRKSIDPIHSASSKYVNWDPTHKIWVGASVYKPLSDHELTWSHLQMLEIMAKSTKKQVALSAKGLSLWIPNSRTSLNVSLPLRRLLVKNSSSLNPEIWTH